MPRVSVLVPVYNEGPAIVDFLDRVFEAVTLPCEALAVYDDANDTTVAHLEKYARREGRLRPLHNTYGRGPAAALRFGVDHAESEVVVVTMADGSDDPYQIDQLTRLVERGVVVACASRYMRGGQQVGGPWTKGAISRLAGMSLHLVGRVGTHDPTNSFKAYSRDFLREAGIARPALENSPEQFLVETRILILGIGVERVVIGVELVTGLRRHRHERLEVAKALLREHAVVFGIEQTDGGLTHRRRAIRSGAEMHTPFTVIAQIQLGKCGLVAARERRLRAALLLQPGEREFDVFASAQLAGGIIRA